MSLAPTLDEQLTCPEVSAAGLTADEVDELARGIATAHVRGDIDDREAAGKFASLVVTSHVLDEVSRYPRGLNDQQRLDLAESLRWSLVQAVLDIERGFFDTGRMLTSSFTGWLRQTGVAFSSRDAIVRPKTLADRLTVVHDLTSPGAADDGRVGALVDAAAERTATDEMLDVLLSEPDELVASTKGMRASSRTFALAMAMRRAMRLPRLCVPTEESDRAWIMAVCQDDHRVAAASLRTVVQLICRLHEGRIDVDERLLALWDDCSLEQLQRLEDAPDELVSALVLGQVMPAPKPSRLVVRALRKRAKALLPSRGWHDLAALLVASFLARTTNPVSDFDGLADEVARAAMAAEARRLAEMWPELVERAASWPGAPMGRDGEEMDMWLAEQLHDLTDQG